jgi:hypothetical protein
LPLDALTRVEALMQPLSSGSSDTSIRVYATVGQALHDEISQPLSPLIGARSSP